MAMGRINITKTPIWDVYGDDDATHDQIFRNFQNNRLDEKIFFDEYHLYEEDAPAD